MLSRMTYEQLINDCSAALTSLETLEPRFPTLTQEELEKVYKARMNVMALDHPIGTQQADAALILSLLEPGEKFASHMRGEYPLSAKLIGAAGYVLGACRERALAQQRDNVPLPLAASDVSSALAVAGAILQARQLIVDTESKS